MTISRAEMLEAVERSPRAAGDHDRAGWLGAFTVDAHLEDPVGSRPHLGRAALERFYDTFIGPRQITFHRDLDVVTGHTVIRDLQLEVTMAAALTMHIPAYLRYDLTRQDDALKITALRAYWALPTMLARFLRGGIRAVPAGVQLSRALLTNQGAAGATGFLRGFRGVGPAGRAEFGRFLLAAARGDEVAVRGRLTRGAHLTLGDDEPLSTADLIARLTGTRPRKLISAGLSLVAGIEHADRRDVLIAEADAGPLTIGRIRYFTDQD